MTHPYEVVLNYTHHGLPVVLVDGQEHAYAENYGVAEDAARDSIEGSLWAFRSEFLRRYVPALENDSARKAFDKMREALCEDANDLVRAMVGDRLEEMVDDAISADGRGHFLSGYDGEEVEVENGAFLYRI